MRFVGAVLLGGFSQTGSDRRKGLLFVLDAIVWPTDGRSVPRKLRLEYAGCHSMKFENSQPEKLGTKFEAIQSGVSWQEDLWQEDFKTGKLKTRK